MLCQQTDPSPEVGAGGHIPSQLIICNKQSCREKSLSTKTLINNFIFQNDIELYGLGKPSCQVGEQLKLILGKIKEIRSNAGFQTENACC